MPAANSPYAPFAHLALARFQRESLDNRNPSAMMQTEMVPLLPDRSLEVHQDGDGLHLAQQTQLRRHPPNRVTAPSNDATLSTPPVAPVDLTVLTGTLPDFPAWVRVPHRTVTGQTPQLRREVWSWKLRLVVPGIGTRSRSFAQVESGIEVTVEARGPHAGHNSQIPQPARSRRRRCRGCSGHTDQS
jgi:hypothetical protein